MQTNYKKHPCKECPYLKNSAKGYLGELSYQPELFLQQLDLPKVHPCHKSVDWEKDDTCEGPNPPICAGALQFMNNSCKSHRNPIIQKFQREIGKNEEVMSFNHNFIEHHKKQ